VVGPSWEGFVIESCLAVCPPRTDARFYRTAAGAEVDLVLDLPREGRWVVEVKRSLSAKPSRGFHVACEDLKPRRRFVVHAGEDEYPLGDSTEAVGVQRVAALLAAL
jgi:hypothetical protein